MFGIEFHSICCLNFELTPSTVCILDETGSTCHVAVHDDDERKGHWSKTIVTQLPQQGITVLYQAVKGLQEWFLMPLFGNGEQASDNSRSSGSNVHAPVDIIPVRFFADVYQDDIKQMSWVRFPDDAWFIRPSLQSIHCFAPCVTRFRMLNTTLKQFDTRVSKAPAVVRHQTLCVSSAKTVKRVYWNLLNLDMCLAER